MADCLEWERRSVDDTSVRCHMSSVASLVVIVCGYICLVCAVRVFVSVVCALVLFQRKLLPCAGSVYVC